MPNEAKILTFTDNNLTNITDNHFEINLIAHLLDQIYIVSSPQSPLRYDDAPPDAMTFAVFKKHWRSDGICTYDAITFAYKSLLIWMYSYKISYFYMNTYFMFILVRIIF